jgi:hypothetical protein
MLNNTLDLLLRRIEGEFLEMPGLQLTREQAQRLWAIDGETCAAVLDELVAQAFLVRGSDQRYRRVIDGPHTRPLRHANTRVTPGMPTRRAS